MRCRDRGYIVDIAHPPCRVSRTQRGVELRIGLSRVTALFAIRSIEQNWTTGCSREHLRRAANGVVQRRVGGPWSALDITPVVNTNLSSPTQRP